MPCPTPNEILYNLKKISELSQEVMLHFWQGHGNFIPPNLLDRNYFTDISQKVWQKFSEHPEYFWQANLAYAQKCQDLMFSSFNKFFQTAQTYSHQGYNPSPSNTTNIFNNTNLFDKRFKDKLWQESLYFDFIKQFYLISSELFEEALKHYDIDPQTQKLLKFFNKQWLDAACPTNFLFSNPKVMQEAFDSGFNNVVRGYENFLNDLKNSRDIFSITMADKKAFEVGKNIAATPGQVVLKNDLMELIKYDAAPGTKSIPILIVPPWINKYYILDLSSHNSFVKFLVDNGFQVFMISWTSPSDDSLANKDFEDYLKEGVLDSCDYILKEGYQKINFLGYCIGGTLLAIALSYLEAHKAKYVNSTTFLTTLLDFTDPGDIGIFINEATIALIEEDMKQKGYFDGRYLANTFSLLRANDLIWSFFVNNYLLGKPPSAFDILYWNSDYTHLPAKMYSYYLRNMYLENNLKKAGKLSMLGTPINLEKINCRSFFLAASEDHITPWQSVYDSMRLLKGIKSPNKTFCLSTSGHIAGVINPPTSGKYSYKINNLCQAALPKNSQDWLASSTEHPGSWWPYWLEWLQ